MQIKSTRQPRILILIILSLCFAIRSFHLGMYAFNGDEAFSIVNWTTTNISTLLTTFAIIDPQPPLALLTLRTWTDLVGYSEIASRSLSTFASLITASTIFATTIILTKQRHLSTSHLATLLFAISPLAIWHAQDVRPYSLWIMMSTLSTFLLLNTLNRPNKKGRWLAIVLITTATLYFYYLEVFFVIARTIYVLLTIHTHRSPFRSMLLAGAMIILLISPWYLYIIPHLPDYHPTASQPTILQTLIDFLYGYHFPVAPFPPILNIQLPPLAHIFTIVTIFTLLILTSIRKTLHTQTLPLLLILIPLATLTILTLLTQQNYFRTRYILPILPPLLISTATALNSPKIHTKPNHPLTISLLLFLTIPNLISLTHYYFNPNTAKSPPWRSVANELAIQTSPTDLILYNYPDPAIEYYLRDTPPVILMPPNATPDSTTTVATLESFTQTRTRIYFLPVYSHWDPNNQIQAWLEANTQLISQQYIGNTLILQFSTWRPTSQHIPHQLSLPIAEFASLLGYRLTPPTPHYWQPGTTIFLEIFWQPHSTTSTNLTIFTHLLGPLASTPIVLQTQEDSPPQDGRLTTTDWTPTTIIRDVYTLTLPATLTAGTYAIAVGFYDTATLQRIPTTNPLLLQQQTNSTTLLTFTIPSLQP